jgi:L-lactate permease
VGDVFRQSYDPVAGSVLLSALVAALPLVVLAYLLSIKRVKPWRSAIAAAGTAFLLAWLVWGMPLPLALSATTHGMAFGLWPISWVVLSAVFFYNLSVDSGDFDVIRRSLSRLTGDRRIQVLLVAFCFGALIEGIAGFGAPVAITASMLVGLGFEPIAAAVLALIANTAPVAFGSMGIPVVTLGGLIAPILGRDAHSTTLALSAMVGRQLPLFSLLIPAYLIVLLAGWRGMIGVWPRCSRPASPSRSGSSRCRTSSSRADGRVASAVARISVALLLKVWQPAPARAAPTTSCRQDRPAPRDTPGAWRGYGTYATLVVVVLIGNPATSRPCVNCRRPRT